MRMTHLFTKTQKEPPKESESANARLLVQAGFVDQLMAGVYTYLPLGLKVLQRIQSIVREEMDAIGGQEILMPALLPAEPWKTTGRWKDPGP
ncbi:proline--tRNA ligase, partial [Patescibacteria group bacterium]|nr:proline--tRNA ligase [Patescibacteria group bacterium]